MRDQTKTKNPNWNHDAVREKLCICGTIFTQRSNEKLNHFTNRQYCSHTCYHKHTTHSRNKKDLTGQVVNGLEFLEPDGKTSSGNILWKVKCRCGVDFTTRPNRIKQGWKYR